MKKSYPFLLSLLTLILLQAGTSHSDVWIPPVGELVADSVFLDLNVEEDSVIIDIRTVHCMLKLISDDYHMSLTRTAEHSYLDPDNVQVEFSDSLGEVNIEENGFDFTGVSYLALEETLTVVTSCRYIYQNRLNVPFSTFRWVRDFNRALDTLDWYAGEVFENGASHACITANQRITVSWTLRYRDEEWHNEGSGTEFKFDLQDRVWNINHSVLRIEIENDDRIRSTEVLTDDLTYILCPEVRAETPGLILTEDVRINLSSYGIPDDYYSYNHYADIQLEPELAIQLAPMWLWYPNDLTDARVAMQGIKSHHYRGHYREEYHCDSLSISRVEEENGQNGFYIYVPRMDNEEIGQMDWWWSDPHLSVQINGRHYGEITRFIVITAPLEPSRIQFSISDILEFQDWTNPFEQVEQRLARDRRQIIFTGECAEPGEAVVSWGPSDVALDDRTLPTGLTLSAYPNPFNSNTTISYALRFPSQVSLNIYNLSGRKIETLFNGRLEAGFHRATLNAFNIPSGLYFIRLETSKQALSRKIMLIN